MDWSRAKGLLDGLESQLSDDEARYLGQEFDTYQVDWSGYIVSRAGYEILKAIYMEDGLLGHMFKPTYQLHFQDVFRRARSGESLPLCCPGHRSMYNALGKALQLSAYKWLKEFLEIVSSISDDLLAQCPCRHDPSPPLRLSRFMKLDNFIKVHVLTPDATTAAQRARMLLSPLLSQKIRHDTLLAKDLGTLNGRIGSYSNEVGASARLLKWCDRLKPFSTFSDCIDAIYDRDKSPEQSLRQLGIPFAKDEWWIEIQFRTENVKIVYPPDFCGLAIPTAADARGNWAFRPDRDVPPKCGYTRNIQDNSRGLPEIICEPLDIRLIDDAIVWGAPTTEGWGENSTLV